MSQMPPPPPPPGYPSQGNPPQGFPPPPPGEGFQQGGYPPGRGYPPPGNYPPGGLPPGGGFPPGGYLPPGMGMPYGQQRTSVSAVASLVLGLLGFCLPFIGGFLAVLLGFIGIYSTRNRMARGRGLAISGLVLGVLTIAFYGMIGTSLGWWWGHTGPQRAVATQFLDHLAQGKADAASVDCTSRVTADQIKTAIDSLQKAGPIQSRFAVVIPSNMASERATATVGFSSGHQIQIDIQLVNENGVWKVDSFMLPP